MAITSDVNYCKMGMIPGIQTIWGGTAFCLNLIGAIKDFAIIILSRKSAENCNDLIKSRITLLKKFINVVKITEENLREVSIEGKAKELPKIENLIKTVLVASLYSPTQENYFKEYETTRTEAYYNNLNSGSDNSQASLKQMGDALKVKTVIDNARSKAEWEIILLSCCKLKSPSQRAADLAIALITAIPVVGTFYHMQQKRSTYQVIQ